MEIVPAEDMKDAEASVLGGGAEFEVRFLGDVGFEVGFEGPRANPKMSSMSFFELTAGLLAGLARGGTEAGAGVAVLVFWGEALVSFAGNPTRIELKSNERISSMT